MYTVYIYIYVYRYIYIFHQYPINILSISHQYPINIPSIYHRSYKTSLFDPICPHPTNQFSQFFSRALRGLRAFLKPLSMNHGPRTNTKWWCSPKKVVYSPKKLGVLPNNLGDLTKKVGFSAKKLDVFKSSSKKFGFSCANFGFFLSKNLEFSPKKLGFLCTKFGLFPKNLGFSPKKLVVLTRKLGGMSHVPKKPGMWTNYVMYLIFRLWSQCGKFTLTQGGATGPSSSFAQGFPLGPLW